MGNELPSQSENLKKLRKKYGYSQQAVAKKIGCTVKTYRSWEKGKRPDAFNLIQLRDLYDGVSTDYLLGLIEEKTHDIKFICEYTGLSEEAINVLSYRPPSEYITSHLLSSYLSPLLENKDFCLCLGSVDYIRGCLNRCASALDVLNEDALNEAQSEYNETGNSDRADIAVEQLLSSSDELRLGIFESSQQWTDMLESEFHYKQILHAAEEMMKKFAEVD